MGVEVFHGFEDARALPFPAVERLLEVVSVALPQGDMPVEQSFCRCVEPIDGRDDGAVAAGDKLRLFVGERYQLTYLISPGANGEFFLFQIVGEEGANGVVHFLDKFFPEGKVGELVVHLDNEAIAFPDEDSI